MENYLDFLDDRRELLAKAANEFLDSLFVGSVPEIEIIPGGIESEEECIIRECNEWIVEQGLPSGEIMYELADPNTGEPLAVMDLAWPDGLQEGYSQPVALLIDEGPKTEEAVKRVDLRHFQDPVAFREYVRREI